MVKSQAIRVIIVDKEPIFSLNINPTATILQLKELINQITNIDKLRIDLTFHGILLNNQSLIKSYEVQHDSEIHITVTANSYYCHDI